MKILPQERKERKEKFLIENPHDNIFIVAQTAFCCVVVQTNSYVTKHENRRLRKSK